MNMSPARGLFYLLLLTAFVGIVPACEGAGFTINSVSTKTDDHTLYVYPDLNLNLSQEVKKAIKHGIPIRIVIEMVLAQRRPFFWNSDIAAWQFPMTIRYHSLTNQFLVGNGDTNKNSSYSTATEAINAIGSQDLFTLELEEPITIAEMRYLLKMRVRVDDELLPIPLRLHTFTDQDWKLNSAWTQWPITK